jgi:hypothetical protein
MTGSSSSRLLLFLPCRHASSEATSAWGAALLVMVASAGVAIGYWRLRLLDDRQGGTTLCRSDGDCAAQFVCRPRKLRDGRMGRACRIRGTGREGRPVALQRRRSTRAAWRTSGATTVSAVVHANQGCRSPVRSARGAAIRVKDPPASLRAPREPAERRHSALRLTRTLPSAPSPSASAAISTPADQGWCAALGIVSSGPRPSKRDV